MVNICPQTVNQNSGDNDIIPPTQKQPHQQLISADHNVEENGENENIIPPTPEQSRQQLTDHGIDDNSEDEDIIPPTPEQPRQKLIIGMNDNETQPDLGVVSLFELFKMLNSLYRLFQQ